MQLPATLSTLLIRVISYNIRFASTNPSGGEQPWSGVRAPRVISQLRFNTIHNPSALVGMQEVLKTQLDDVVAGLNADRSGSEPEWAFIGVGRENGKEKGEYSPILYRPAVWELLNFTNLWLSETPDVPSKGWDAANTRILTIGDFRHRETGAEVVAMNTHFDHVGTVARENSARIITEQINKRQSSEPVSVLLTGDFNSQPGQEAYQYLTQESSPVYDARTAIPEDQRYGNRIGSFTGFNGRSESLIDYIFLNKKGGWNAKTYAVLANIFDEHIYYSDHQAVVADVELNTDNQTTNAM